MVERGKLGVPFLKTPSYQSHQNNDPRVEKGAWRDGSGGGAWRSKMSDEIDTGGVCQKLIQLEQTLDKNCVRVVRLHVNTRKERKGRVSRGD